VYPGQRVCRYCDTPDYRKAGCAACAAGTFSVIQLSKSIERHSVNDIGREIIKKASEGDLGAFEAIYKSTSSLVFNVALRICRSRADAEEVTQDVFMKALRGLKSFDFRSSFRTWMYRIAVNTAINKYNQTMRHVRLAVDIDSVVDHEALQTHESRPEFIDTGNRLKKFLDALQPEFKAVIVLREIEGLSYEEIAAVLRIPLNTVRSRLSRARETLIALGRQEALRHEL
jgi:RNA polymerase sigma-70 factor, ECF subfamily